MSEQELYTLLQTLHLPVAYDHFDSSTKPPFIVYRDDEPTNVKAEDQVWYKGKNYIVELATENKNISLENQLEDLFDANHLSYDKEEFYIDEERMYQIRFYLN